MPEPGRPRLRGRFLCLLGAAAAAAAACAAGSAARRAPAPLENEGIVYLFVDALPPEARRLAFAVTTVTAARDDGLTFPLDVALAHLSESQLPHPRLLAQGRLPPGRYTGFRLGIGRATLRREDGLADLLVPSAPAPVDLAFAVGARQAAVVSLELDYAASLRGVEFAPRWRAQEPPPPVADLLGLCSSAAADRLLVFDKRARAVTGVRPLSGGPAGMALDALRRRAYVALTREDAVLVLDLVTGRELGRVRLAPGDAPREVALGADRRTLVVAAAGSNSVVFADTSLLAETGRAPAGEDPASVLVDRFGRRAYVFARRSNTVTVVDVAARSVVATVGTEAEPLRGQLNRAGDRLWIVHGGSPNLLVLSVPELAPVGRVFVGLGAGPLEIDRRTDLAWVGRPDAPGLSAYDSFSMLPVDEVETPGGTTHLAVDETENVLFAAMPDLKSVAVVDLGSRRLAAVMETAEPPGFLALAGRRD